MGVPSKAQLLAAKADALAAANKTGRHRQILAKKKLKRERNQLRNKKKAEKEREQPRGRDMQATAASDVASDDKSRKTKIVPGQGSGTPGAKAAAAKVPKAVQLSKRGGRRRKATWRSLGMA
ncbi:unnamed protein product [Effrenium voratum]|nr:unnamed protein product [Effrenium voratum]|mmetsp:Transcript_45319/g.107698  ORF Transcript_45319/g.107698 Transcript_45319/m.107698 type:complete len:122 (-) Transcript_45319:99-464(-)|eukprot:CAMPEP_0181471402 /NCGR_PEP_ID=MMETSP1110-20121109/39055_1 /TAXON_ID=174948 /ORGANISM="Symbiodinium sp., Strain CCMP421" /LENGTH=121 /DNA_ID=CAMNT_0023596417 /DNA_START=43 /DNA_END=405 /DNA_ORIENTATION=+